MFGLGFGELLVIMVVVLLVFGPEKLPDIARTLGKTMAELRRSVDDIKHELTLPRLDDPVVSSKPTTPTTTAATPAAAPAEAPTVPASAAPPVVSAEPAPKPDEASIPEKKQI